jgi:hypothetical protein
MQRKRGAMLEQNGPARCCAMPSWKNLTMRYQGVNQRWTNENKKRTFAAIADR